MNILSFLDAVRFQPYLYDCTRNLRFFWKTGWDGFPHLQTEKEKTRKNKKKNEVLKTKNLPNGLNFGANVLRESERQGGRGGEEGRVLVG